MLNDDDWEFFNTNGYILLKNVLDNDHLKKIQACFKKIAGDCNTKAKWNQHILLKHQEMIDLIEHPPIIDNIRALYGSRTQLLQYDFLYQPPSCKGDQRLWHRDLVFPGDNIISNNSILYLEDIDEESGPTYVVPGSHRGWIDLPEGEALKQPREDEVAIHAKAGDMAVINSAILHSGGLNKSKTCHRRNIYMYFGYWWMKRYENNQLLPWECLKDSTETRLELLGVKQYSGDMHIYKPDALRAGS